MKHGSHNDEWADALGGSQWVERAVGGGDYEDGRCTSCI